MFQPTLLLTSARSALLQSGVLRESLWSHPGYLGSDALTGEEVRTHLQSRQMTCPHQFQFLITFREYWCRSLPRLPLPGRSLFVYCQSHSFSRARNRLIASNQVVCRSSSAIYLRSRLPSSNFSEHCPKSPFPRCQANSVCRHNTKKDLTHKVGRTMADSKRQVKAWRAL